MQTRAQSMIETLTNLLVGYTVSILANFAIFPIMGWTITLEENLTVGIFYTAVSIARSYALRRFYNRLHNKQNQEKAAQ